MTAVYIYVVVGDTTWQRPAADGLVYWAVNLDHLYVGATVGGQNAYLYSPAFAQVFSLIGLLPREVFIVGWTLTLTLIAAWLARPWPPALLVLALPVSQEIMIGNIHLVLASAIVLGFRYAPTWSFVLLTKVTPGIGLIWFAVRREWRHGILAGGTTLAIAGISYVLNPSAWRDWVEFLRHDGGTGGQGLLLRLAIAAIVTAFGALTNRAWTVPMAAMIGLPVVWMDSFSMLLGCVALSRYPRASSPRDGSVTTGDVAPPTDVFARLSS